MPDYLSLISSQPGTYDEAAAVLRTLAARLDEAGNTVNRARSRAVADWTGRSGQAFDAAVGATLGDLERAGAAANEASQVLNAAAGELSAAVTEIRTMVGSAEAAGFMVLPEGVVMIGPAQEAEAAAAGPGAPEVLAAYEAAAAELTANLESMVAAATAADESFAAALRGPIAALSGGGTGGRSGGPPAPPGGSSGQVPYGSTSLSQLVQQQRKLDHNDKNNYASASWVDANGQTQTAVAKSVGKNNHAEKELLDEIRNKVARQQGIAPADVDLKSLNNLQVYSEYEPCTTKPNYCGQMLSREVPQAKVSYTWPWDPPSVRPQSRKDFITAMKALNPKAGP